MEEAQLQKRMRPNYREKQSWEVERNQKAPKPDSEPWHGEANATLIPYKYIAQELPCFGHMQIRLQQTPVIGVACCQSAQFQSRGSDLELVPRRAGNWPRRHFSHLLPLFGPLQGTMFPSHLNLQDQFPSSIQGLLPILMLVTGCHTPVDAVEYT